MLSKILKALPPEVAHRAAIRSAMPLKWLPSPAADERFRTEAFGLSFPNPLGLAAGFDKNAEAVEGLGRLGFGFVEVGTVTPRPQAGNPKPRLFRLDADRAIVNRMGFNNQGYLKVVSNLQRASRRGIVGVNIGPNKDSVDRALDYVLGIQAFENLADYFAINISSPNTPGLRNFHEQGELERLLVAVIAARGRLLRPRPLLLKISPDIEEKTLEGVLSLALDYKIDGLIVSNTTVKRPASLSSSKAHEIGGLSGPPLFSVSNRLVALCYLRCGSAIPIVGVGGIENAQTALAKIEAGARLIQIYTGFIYGGPKLIKEVLLHIGEHLTDSGLVAVHDLVGRRAKEIVARTA